MCTSFTIYSNEIFYGMNFDISSRPIKFSVVKKNGNKALIIFQKENDSFYPAFGFTEQGAFANLLMVNLNEKGKYRRGKNVVHILKIFDEVLSNQITVEEIPEQYRDHSIVNVPNISVHSMIANLNRTIFVEPGESIVEENHTFSVLDNRSVCDNRKDDIRYQACYLGLEKNEDNMTVEKGFEILEACCQRGGEYPTQLSVIAKPGEKEIYFAKERDFKRIYKYSFEADEIQAWKGEHDFSAKLSKKGLLLSDFA